MKTSDASWSGRLRVIGDLERPDHWHLTADDNRAFIGEYTARAGFGHSRTNSLISNLKKPPSTRGTPQWYYKGEAIREVGWTIANNLTAEALASSTFVPIPPSKPPTALDYDDRMIQVARAIGRVDVREVLFTHSERGALHASNDQRDMLALRQSISIRMELTNPIPTQVILLDDMLTTGCSFKACKSILAAIWPTAPFYGIFVARRVIDRPPIEDVFGAITFPK